MSASGAKVGTLWDRIREGLLLRRAEERAAAFSAPTAEELKRLTSGAQSRWQVARALRDSGEAAASATLYREVAMHLVAALWVAEGTELEEQSPLNALEARLQDGEFAGFSSKDLEDKAPLRRTIELANSTDTLHFDAMSAVDARLHLEAVDAALTRMARGIEPRSVSEIKRARWARILAGALGVIALLAGGLYLLLAPKNVAFGKPVIADSYWPGSAPADTLVNGDIEDPWGSATAQNGKAWFRIDLQAPMHVTGAKIVNRNDRFANVNQGVVIEISDDDHHFKEIASSDKTKQPGDSWRFRKIDAKGRFVRIRRLKGAGSFALSEIEIYGE